MKNHLVAPSKIREIKRALRPIEYNDLIDAVTNAQNIEIQKCLGQSLYNSHTSKVNSTEATFTSAEQTLVQDVVAPTMAEYTMYHHLGIGNARFSKQGILVASNANFTAAEPRQMENMGTITLGVAQHYGTLLMDYLKANKESFPQFDFGNEDIEPLKGNDFNIGIW